jgi:CheY-like chemotaxis protein
MDNRRAPGEAGKSPGLGRKGFFYCGIRSIWQDGASHKNLGNLLAYFMSKSMEYDGAGPKNILVVDDTPSVSDLIREMLQSFGHQVDIRPDAKTALAVFEPGKYDLVITDYTMPVTNGVDFAHLLRKRSPGQHIILITGSAFTLSDIAAQSLPVNSILQKPFSVMEFQSALVAAFETGRATAQPPQSP